MIIHFRKGHFRIKIKRDSNCIIVTLSKAGHTVEHHLTLLDTGGVYTASANGWVQVDVSALSSKINNLERGCEALVEGLKMLKIGLLTIQMSLTEQKFLEVIFYDIISNKIQWLLNSKLYDLYDTKVVVDDGIRIDTYVISENIRNTFIPKITIRPIGSKQNVTLDTFQVKNLQSNRASREMPEGGKYKSFYDLVKKRGRYAKDNPNLADEMFPNRHADHIKCMKYEADQRLADQSQGENVIKIMESRALEIKKKNEEMKMKKIMKEKKSREEQLDKERMIRLQIIQAEKTRREQEKIKQTPRLIIVQKEESETTSDDETEPGIVPDSVFVRAKQNAAKKQPILTISQKVGEEDDWFDEIVKSANPDVPTRKTENETLMDEVVDSIYSFTASINQTESVDKHSLSLASDSE